MKILIGNAWPYANGSLHIGHVAALLPGDVLARYHRAIGNQVTFVSGSDCHGTPVAIRARQEGRAPGDIAEAYHREFAAVFEKLGFSYDRYGKTTSTAHTAFVKDFHRAMYAGDFIYEKEGQTAYCPACRMSLSDRYIIGICPICEKEARGDQCDACGSVPEIHQLQNPRCALCGGVPTFQKGKHLYIALTRMADALEDYLSAHAHWRRNAIAFTRRYMAEGLRDRAITRDLDWGISVPRAGYEEKVIYIWAENVLGYLSMAKAVAEERGESFASLFEEDSRHFYVHGKDNIPFHTIILPALMLAHGGPWKLPDDIISSEFMTLEGRKISTSGHWAIWAEDLMGRYHPDSIRYFLLANGPEKRDGDFTFREFVHGHNSELLGAYGNFINRTLAFIQRYLGGRVPEGRLDEGIADRMGALYHQAGDLIAEGKLKDALEMIFAFVREANRYFDEKRPWETRTADPAACGHTLFTCVQIAGNLAALLGPFLPFSSQQVFSWLGLDEAWAGKAIPEGYGLPKTDVLFTRLDKDTAEKELERLSR